jgi:hypothetical protein
MVIDHRNQGEQINIYSSSGLYLDGDSRHHWNKISVRNEPCKLEIYYPYDMSTQCRRCQLYGHPTALCTPQHPIACAVCAQEHLTADHPCKYPNFLAGPRCHHPPIKCAACQGLYKASDQNCPARARAIERAKQVRLFGPNMNHQEPRLSRPTSSLGSIEVAHTPRISREHIRSRDGRCRLSRTNRRRQSPVGGRDSRNTVVDNNQQLISILR